jgi:hypothetical protein
MPKFRKKPVVVEALQWNEDIEPMRHFLGAGIYGDNPVSFKPGGRLIIPTLEGDMTAYPGDWIIKGIHGEFYPCKPDIFEQTYEPVE